jgi:pimeloyl-ACP methyl ester carboxylesterase
MSFQLRHYPGMDGCIGLASFAYNRSYMRKTLAFLVLFSAVVCRGVWAQQVPAAIDADPPANPKFPAAMQSFQIPSHGAQLNALTYIAAGAGPHPVVVLLHGFPGNEKNLDLAQAIRREGWDVLYFNYRGSWGSPGDFSFTHSTEDVAAALAYLRDPANAARLRADPKRIVLIGHSMGGFMAAYGAAHDPAVVGAAIISGADFGAGNYAAHPEMTEAQVVSKLAPRLAEEGMAPLSGCTPEGLAAEVWTNRADWQFSAFAPGLGMRPVLIVTSDDGLGPTGQALADALKQAGNKQVAVRHFTTDHAYSDKRIGLEKTVLAWLATLP